MMTAPDIRQRQIDWLREMRDTIDALRIRLAIEGDAILPTGFARGRTMEAAAMLERASKELQDAIRERKGGNRESKW